MVYSIQKNFPILLQNLPSQKQHGLRERESCFSSVYWNPWPLKIKLQQSSLCSIKAQFQWKEQSPDVTPKTKERHGLWRVNPLPPSYEDAVWLKQQLHTFHSASTQLRPSDFKINYPGFWIHLKHNPSNCLPQNRHFDHNQEAEILNLSLCANEWEGARFRKLQKTNAKKPHVCFDTSELHIQCPLHDFHGSDR